MKRTGIAGAIAGLLLLGGCLQTELTPEQKQLVSELKGQLSTLAQDIETAETATESLSSGLLKSLIEMRLEVLKTNRALIEQRILSIESGSPVKQVTETVKADPALAAKLEAELINAKADLAASEREAQSYGGLLGLVKATSAATEAQTVAMLKQRLLAAKYGLSVPTIEPPQSETPRLAGTTGGVSKEEIAVCADIATLSIRHTCYDDLAARHGLASANAATAKHEEPAAPAPATGAWMISVRTDPLTDKEIHSAILIAKTGRSRYGNSQALTVRCSNNQTEMYINWNDYLGSDAYTTYRVGQAKAVTSNWSLSTDKQAAFFPGSPVATLKQMMESDTFAASITPYNESPVTVVFDITGAAEAFSGIREACNW